MFDYKMRKIKRKLSIRLLRKGALIEETYAAFRNWDLAASFKTNIANMGTWNTIGATNEKWLREITATLSSRFADNESIEPLVILARCGLAIDKWRSCLLWHIGRTDYLYYQFATQWLYDRYQDGTYSILTKNVLPFVKNITDGRIASGGNLTEYGAVRAARDLLRMAAEFGIVKGKVKKKFSSYHMPQEAFLYVLHGLAETVDNTQQILDSKDWHLFLMDSMDVEREIFRLHQFKALEYQIAGSIAQLKLPNASLKEYARGLMV
jgi:hypothetical protein